MFKLREDKNSTKGEIANFEGCENMCQMMKDVFSM